jgi:hypothetical protein
LNDYNALVLQKIMKCVLIWNQKGATHDVVAKIHLTTFELFPLPMAARAHGGTLPGGVGGRQRDLGMG